MAAVNDAKSQEFPWILDTDPILMKDNALCVRMKYVYAHVHVHSMTNSHLNCPGFNILATKASFSFGKA